VQSVDQQHQMVLDLSHVFVCLVEGLFGTFFVMRAVALILALATVCVVSSAEDAAATEGGQQRVYAVLLSCSG